MSAETGEWVRVSAVAVFEELQTEQGQIEIVEGRSWAPPYARVEASELRRHRNIHPFRAELAKVFEEDYALDVGKR